MAGYTVILDACVMYPAPLRSLLMYLANTDLFRARWTEKIHDEWTRNLLINNSSVTKAQLDRVVGLMNANVPDCLIEGYETLIEGITLPDVDDRHVVAAAIKGQAESIITFNLKDFPPSELDVYDICAVHPDEFLSDMFELDASKVIEATRKHRASLRKPSLTANEYLDCLQRQKLPNFVSKLRSFAITI